MTSLVIRKMQIDSIVRCLLPIQYIGKKMYTSENNKYWYRSEKSMIHLTFFGSVNWFNYWKSVEIILESWVVDLLLGWEHQGAGIGKEYIASESSW